MEINYVIMYVMYWVCELEKKMWSIVVCFYLVDVIDEVFIRYGFIVEDIMVNKMLKSVV